MPRKLFDRELEELVREMIDLGNAVDDRIEKTIDCLRTLDMEKAKYVAAHDQEINRKEHKIEILCLNLLALQQPIAKDLRMIAACLKILTDIEREGDQCADVCEILGTGQVSGNSLVVSKIIQMMEAAHDMFRRSMDVFISRDIEQAKDICKSDDYVDNLFSKVILEISSTIAQSANVMGEVDLLLITKYAERMADHATNIAEWVIYIETGEHRALNGDEFTNSYMCTDDHVPVE